ncbi:MAG: hypothetical protein AAF708_11000 [Deinococcota bacterium]
MRYLAKLILFLCLLLAYTSVAQVDDSIFRQPIEFEDFLGETTCMEAHATICGHNTYVCNTTDLSEFVGSLRDVLRLDADAFVCTVSGRPNRGTETVVSLRLHHNAQIADLYMLRTGDFEGFFKDMPFKDSLHEDAAILSFELLDMNSYVYTKRNTYRSTRQVFYDNGPETVISRRGSEKYLRIFSVVANSLLSTKEIPLADHEFREGSFEEFLDGKYVDEEAIESYEEWLARIETLPDQLTYTLDWPNTLTISVNPGTEPTEAQLEWVGVHNLSPMQP